jgi:dTDP-4-amino-4,6-dideoxygalactose transaminase
MQIKIFTPPKFNKNNLDINNLNNITNKKWQYSANGRSSIYHILKDLNIKKILIPIYICQTVLEPLKKLKMEPIFYDIDIKDLNFSLESIKVLSKKYNIKVILIASMYGNPADLVEIEKYCKENNIYLIDDAAQSFGAMLDNRYIGTFGNAGFFSFSPGKPTAGHMGSFFWADRNININRSKHCFTHYLRYLNFNVNRYNIYKTTNIFYKNILIYLNLILTKFIDIKDDDICNFEKEIIGGILNSNLYNKFNFRQNYFYKFTDLFNDNKFFNVLKNIRGQSNNHKFILIFYTQECAKSFLNYMNENNIYVSNGYSLLTNKLDSLQNAKSIDKMVVEIPIEDDEDKMSYLFKKVEEFNG